MAEEHKDKAGPSTAVVAGSAILALGLVGLVVFFHHDAKAAQEDLDQAKRQYKEMVAMRRSIDESRRKGTSAQGPATSSEDILTFLDKKRAQAGLPPVAPAQQDVPPGGGWKERIYTITLSGTKEAPLSRGAVADFLRLVEDERPNVRTKNLKLVLAAGDALSSALITLSSFQREPRP